MTNQAPNPDPHAPLPLNYQTPTKPKPSAGVFVALAFGGVVLTFICAIAMFVLLFNHGGFMSLIWVPPAFLVAINFLVYRNTPSRGFLLGSLIAAGLIFLLFSICAVLFLDVQL
jgi:hypothetical protein